jgi:uncharacterized protein YegJ (DUF2314 family)
MNRAIRYCTLCLLPLSCGCSKPATDDRVVNVAADDAEMEAAIATARSKLPDFWKVFDQPAPGDSDFALKVQITDPNGTEHFWVNELERTDGTIHGTINNDPGIVQSVKFGQRIEVPEADISDWTYMRGGKMFGNYTLRPLFKSMSQEEVEQFKSILAEP